MTAQTIGRYEVIRELGQGGMAVVFLAQDPLMKRQVAIKVLPRQFTFDPNFRARFQREAEVIAGLEHPAIVPVYDFGEFEDQPYIVMRFMPGGSLADRMEKGPLSLKEIAAVFERLTAALDAAHKTGLVHRDLKPANVLFDQWGEAYLSDFGIVKLAESRSMGTGTGIIGTPAYMSPEQAAGKGAVDGRSDIYSLGVILYELLTGQQPYVADTPMGQAVAHIVEPIPSILVTAPKLPKACDPIIRRALAKNPADRYQTCGALAEVVNQLAENPNLVVAPPTVTPLSKATQQIMAETLATLPPGALPAEAVKQANRSAAVPSAPPVKAEQTAQKESRAPMAFALTGATLLAVIGLGLVVCVGGAFAITFLRPTETPTPTITHTATATPTEQATLADTPTLTPTLTATVTAPPTETATDTPTATRTRILFTATPAFTATPVCNPPEYFDPALNRCRINDSGNNDSGSGSGGDSGNGSGSGPTATKKPTNTPLPIANP